MNPIAKVIAQRAYEKYLERGRQDGYDREDWLAAEQELQDKINKVLQTLTYRERTIVVLLLHRMHTVEEVAHYLHVTPARIKQIEAQAIRKLEHPVRMKVLQG